MAKLTEEERLRRIARRWAFYRIGYIFQNRNIPKSSEAKFDKLSEKYSWDKLLIVAKESVGEMYDVHLEEHYKTLELGWNRMIGIIEKNADKKYKFI